MERRILIWHQKSGIISGEKRKFPGSSFRDLHLVCPSICGDAQIHLDPKFNSYLGHECSTKIQCQYCETMGIFLKTFK